MPAGVPGESLNPLGRSELRQVWDLPHDEATGPRARRAVPTETEQREAKDRPAGRPVSTANTPEDAESGTQADQTRSVCAHRKEW